MCTSSNSSNTTEGSTKDPQPEKIKRSKLSPTSRLSDMFSQDQTLASELNDSLNQKRPLVYTETEQCANKTSHTANPINYNPSNPRSIKNMSFLPSADAKELIDNSLQPALKESKQKFMKPLSVKKRIETLTDEIPEVTKQK